MPELDYTGHPFLDVGLATLTAFARKRHPAELTDEDLQAAAEYMARNYVVNPLRSFLSVAFPNSGFTQPAYNKTPEKREIYARRVLMSGLDAAPADDTDPFTGRPAAAVPYDVKGELPLGRAFRQHIPLTTGEGYINFHPQGDAGIPLSGESMLAFQALPLGCAKVGGRLLAVHSDDPGLLLHFARTFLRENLRNIQIAQAAREKKLPETSLHRARTTLIVHLLEAQREVRRSAGVHPPASLTAYYFTNSGQGADLEIIPLPLEVTAFLDALHSPRYQPAWEALVQRGWQITKARKEKQAPSPRYNRLYEDLFTLPQEAATFLRRYFLRRKAGKFWGKDDPTQTYHSLKEAGLISWTLTHLFLRKVLHMDENRIEHIRKLGDDLARYVVTQNDRRFFNAFWMARSYSDLRMALLRASNAEVRRGNPPIITLEQFLAIFEMGENLPYADWRLGRDLVLIRLFEQLHAQGWLQQHADELETTDKEAEESL